jgi:hypothetical protein
VKVGFTVLEYCTAVVIGLAGLMDNESRTSIRTAHELLLRSEIVFMHRDYSHSLPLKFIGS